MKNNKGITLVALVITIIVLIIISSIAIYSGTDTVRYTKFNKAKVEMEFMQATVNSWYTEYINIETDDFKSKELKQKEFIEQHGTIATDSNYCDETALNKTVQATGINAENFRYLSEKYLNNNLGLNSNFEFLVNIPERTVILFNGIKYQGRTYYTANDFELRKIEHINPVESITLKLEKNDEKREIIIKDLSFKDSNKNENDISKFNVYCSITGTDNWSNVNSRLIKFEENGITKYKFTVDEPNFYDVRVSTIDKKYSSDLYTTRIVALNFAKKEIDFTENQIIDTGIKLFSEENRNKDFIIKFTIDEFGNNAVNDTLVNAKREDNTSLYPGLTFRCSGTDKYQFKFDVNTKNKSTFTYTKDELLHHETKISKINNVVFIQAAGGAREFVVDLKTVDTTQFYKELADTVLTLGASFIDGDSNRFFSGKVSNVEISLFDHVDTIKRENELYVAKENIVLDKTVEKLLIFDGTNDLPEIKFFTAENINKDFEIKIKVESFGANSYKQQDTILSTKLEVKGKNVVVPGFVFRRSSPTAFEIKGKTNAYSSTSNNNMLGQTVTIRRTEGTYTAQIGNGTPKNFTTTATQQNDTPLIIGGIKYTNGEIDRMVNCVISELSIKIFEEVEID